MSLCALHCEMRNTEQLLKSIGLIAHQIGTLQECNQELSKYGPSNFKGDRISVKLKQGQQTAAGRHNISVASFSGSTERKILSSLGEIVEKSLPAAKMTAHFNDPEAAKLSILNKITFCEARQKYFKEMLDSGIFIRDFGTKLEEIQLMDSAVGKELKSRMEWWKEKQVEIENEFKVVYKAQDKLLKGKLKREKKKVGCDNHALSSYAAMLTVEFLVKVCSQWKEIALIIRDGQFSADEEHLIDILDVQCKEWGFLLLEMFGPTLGTGDYGHITIEHVSMLFRNHRSLNKLSNQGFEAAHKLQRQLYSKATSHDAVDSTSSLDQIFTHLYTEQLLQMRYAFREAVNCIESGKPFYYRGCGWKPWRPGWSKEEKEWIQGMDAMFTRLFGPDFCEYDCIKPSKATILSPGQITHDVQDILIFSNDQVHNNTAKASVCNLARYVTLPGDPNAFVGKGSGSCSDPACDGSGEADPDCDGSGEADPDCDGSGEADTDCDGNGEADPDCYGNGEADPDCDGSSKANPDSNGSGEANPVSDGTSCDLTNAQDYDTCNVSRRQLMLADFQNGKLNSLTRNEAAAYCFPKASYIPEGDVSVSKNSTKLFNPLLASGRPPESTVQHAMKLLRTCPNNVVRIGHLGCYNLASLKVFEKMCALESDASKLRQEIRWLSQTPEALDTAGIKGVLINSRLQEVIFQQGQSIMDLADFCTLACERYVSSFAIDTTCLTFQKEGKQNDVVYLPCYSQSWAKQGARYFSQKVSGYFSHCSADAANIILTPIHIPARQHWGLLCFDAVSRTIYFDDGLKIIPPQSTIPLVKNMLNGFRVLSNDSKFKWQQWNYPRLCLPLPRINMPQQTTTGVGAGSCGIGVILSVRDILRSGTCLPSFQWEFRDMAFLRKQLMCQILEWRNKTN